MCKYQADPYTVPAAKDKPVVVGCFVLEARPEALGPGRSSGTANGVSGSLAAV